MQFRSRTPQPPLDALVENFWAYENYQGEHLHERILPTGTFEIVFNLLEDELRIYGPSDAKEIRRFSGAVVSGPYAGSFMSDTREEAAIMGVHFRPGGAFPILGIPASEFANSHVDLAALWGAAASLLREQLCEASGPAERFSLLEQSLCERLRGIKGRSDIRAGLKILIQSAGQARVRDVASAIDLSQRRFSELFAKEIGLAPKTFGRILRFRNVADASLLATKLDWAQLAIECGYSDQSHLIREFVELSGVSPTDYFQRHFLLARSGTHVKRHHLPLVN